jgi:hypothetical protein
MPGSKPAIAGYQRWSAGTNPYCTGIPPEIYDLQPGYSDCKPCEAGIKTAPFDTQPELSGMRREFTGI